jgi:hypothetical protein
MGRYPELRGVAEAGAPTFLAGIAGFPEAKT